MRRSLLVSAVALAALALVLAGCDDDDGATTAEPELSDENLIEGAIVVWYGDDKQAACGILSSEALKEIGGIDKCLDNAADPQGTQVEVSDIQVEGETATATVVAGGGTVVDFELVREEGQWLVRSPTPLIF